MVVVWCDHDRISLLSVLRHRGIAGAMEGPPPPYTYGGLGREIPSLGTWRKVSESACVSLSLPTPLLFPGRYSGVADKSGSSGCLPGL